MGKKENSEPQEVSVPAVGVKRRGVVLASDSLDKQQAKEFLFVEMYTTDLVGRTKMKFTHKVNMDTIEDEFDQLFALEVQSF